MIPDKSAYGRVYLRCVENKIPHAVRDRLKAVLPEVSELYAKYIEIAPSAQLFSFEVKEKLGTITDHISDQEMHDLYDTSMVRKKGGGRADYDRIKLAPPFGICPYCGQLPVKTLDHFLPRSKWKMLSVCQVNLVPACRDCNAEKKEYSPNSPADTLFHPYFDNKDAYDWLCADVVESTPVRFEFCVKVGNGGALFSSRAVTHFEKLKLKVLYETQAATEVASLAGPLFRIYKQAGAAGVRHELENRCEDNKALSLNSWRSAMYAGAAKSQWFCEMHWL